MPTTTVYADCDCCVPDCPAGVYRFMWGRQIQAGTCGCARINQGNNGTFFDLLKKNGECVYETLIGGACFLADNARITATPTELVVFGYTSTGGVQGNLVRYTIQAGDMAAGDVLTYALASSAATCTNWPPTLTLTPIIF